MNGALTFQKWFSRLVVLFVIWNCVGLRYTVNSEAIGVHPEVSQSQGSFSLFLKEAPSLKLIYLQQRKTYLELAQGGEDVKQSLGSAFNI